MYSHDVSPLISPAPGSDHRLPLAGRRRAAVVEWVGEIIAMVVSIVALVVVAGIAWTMNDRPLAEWPLTKSATPISINAVISAITVLSRATLAVPIVACVSQLKWLHFRTPRMVSDMDVFDSASRGGLGSLQFLFKIPKNGAALGALATVLAYAMGPFYQQAIRLEQRDIEVAGNQTAAAFGFSHEYVTGVKQAPGGGYLDLRTVDTQMQGAMIAGLFGYEIPSNFNCSSVCSWPGPFTTLGFHQECRNITVETLATKICRSVDGDEVDDTAQSTHNCTLMTPSKIPLFTDVSPTSKRTGVYLTGKTISFPLNNTGEETDASFNMTKSPNIFTAIRYNIVRDDNSDTVILGEDIQECTVSVAAHTYTDIRASGNTLTIGHDDIVSAQLSIKEVDSRFIYSSPGIPDLAIQQNDLKVIIGFLRSEFTDKTLELGLSAKEELGLSGSLPTQDLKDALTRMTLRMTQRIADGPNRQVMVGKTIERVVFVEAWYPMLALPVFVTTMALLLLLFTMWQSRSSTGTALWKSSALALLYHNVRPSDDPLLTGGALQCDFRDLKDLKRKTKAATVQKVG